jgi:hypothetical protein
VSSFVPLIAAGIGTVRTSQRRIVNDTGFLYTRSSDFLLGADEGKA